MGRLARIISLFLSLALMLPSAGGAQAQTEEVVTAVALQSFQNGIMFWREDLDRITVNFAQVRTKDDKPCSEIYRDTYDGQEYALPPAPAGFTVPKLGFGWLYKNDPELARRLGHAEGDEVSRIATITTTISPEGTREIDVKFSEPIGSVIGLSASESQEPGLTYCFPRRNENRDVVNTWVSIQNFEHGYMTWRQDMPGRVRVDHLDSQFAQRGYTCTDVFPDEWKPGMVLEFGELAVPGKRLPQKGFGKIWLAQSYVRESLGYPTSAERGGFAEISYRAGELEGFGSGLHRRQVAHFSDGDQVSNGFVIGGVTVADDARGDLPDGCQTILTPHS